MGRQVTSELNPSEEIPERLWTGRAEFPDGEGVLTNCGVRVVPLNPLVLSKNGEYYTSSTTTVRNTLEQLCRTEISSDAWKDIFVTEGDKRDAVVTLATNNLLVSRMRQSLSDSASVRKRMARDHMFSSLGYERLVSRNSVHSYEDVIGRTVDIQIAKDKLLRKLRSREDFDCGWWRTAPLGVLERSSELNVIQEGAGEYSCDEGLVLFRDEKCIQTFHTFLGYVPNKDSVHVECSILSFARLDAWVFSVAFLISPKDTR